MKLALSGRLWETAQGYTSTLLEQIAIAADLGYQGIEARYPMIPEQSQWDAMKAALVQHGIRLVFSPAATLPRTPEQRKDFIRVLDFLRHCGGMFLKIMPKDESENELMRIAADLGAECGIKVLSQYHANMLTDTVEKTEKFFRTVNHPNLGLIWDSCHIPFSETIAIDEAIERLWPWIDLVNLQRYKLSKPDDSLQHSTINGREWSLALPGDPAGTDLQKTVEVLRSRGYDGWLTVMPAVDVTMDPLVVAKAYRDFVLALI